MTMEKMEDMIIYLGHLKRAIHSIHQVLKLSGSDKMRQAILK